jgi:carbamoyl-phosphate synthase large subunit
LPPYNLSDAVIDEMERQAKALALALGVKGLMNIQFAVKDGDVYLIEVNPRASRTVPFVAKAIGQPVAKIAARVMAGEKLSTFPPFKRKFDYMAVKEAVFPFARFPGVDPVLSPEMKSTGEVMGIDADFATAFAKAQLGAGVVQRADGRLVDCVAHFGSVEPQDHPVGVLVDEHRCGHGGSLESVWLRRRSRR